MQERVQEEPMSGLGELSKMSEINMLLHSINQKKENPSTVSSGGMHNDD